MHNPYTNHKKVQLKQRFWTIVIALVFFPTINTAIYNSSHLIKNVMANSKLKSEKALLENEKQVLESKIREYKSSSGLKRAIKEEINLVEKNEILVKII